jgi:hypothetical protein
VALSQAHEVKAGLWTSRRRCSGRRWRAWPRRTASSGARGRCAEGLKAARDGGDGRAGVGQSQRPLLAGSFAVDVVPAETKRHAPFPVSVLKLEFVFAFCSIVYRVARMLVYPSDNRCVQMNGKALD